jgi:membrane associated rhomboid family serine protease
MSEPDAAPPAAPAPVTCYRHADRETGRRCTRCGRPACWECLRDAPVGAHCAECVKGAQPPASEQMRRQVRSLAGDPLLVTKILVALNFGVWILQIAHGAGVGTFFGGGSSVTTAFDRRWGLVTSAVAAGQYERLLTHGFIHFGLIHIGFNMLILYRLGQDMEAGIGRLRFALIYFASLFAGAFGVVLLGNNSVNGGASGAIFGLAGAATIGLFQRGVKFSMTGWGPLLLVNLVITFTIPGISIGAHLGGLVGGTLVGWFMLHPVHGVQRKAAGYVLAVVVMVGSIVGSIAWAQHRYPPCVGSTGDLHAACTGDLPNG